MKMKDIYFYKDGNKRYMCCHNVNYLYYFIKPGFIQSFSIHTFIAISYIFRT